MSDEKVHITAERPLVIIMQGGAMLAAFGAGVLYELAERGIFPRTIASASAGIPTAAYYAARQHEDMRAVWTKDLRGNFVNVFNLLFGKPIFNIQHVLHEVLRKRNPLSVESLARSETRLVIPLYNYQKGGTELRTSKDDNFLEQVWSLLHVSLIVHPDHILYGTSFEQYVDGALDPFALYKEDFFPDNARVLVIWNESKFGMHPLKYIGQKLFIWLQLRGAPEGMVRALYKRDTMISEGVKAYEEFCIRRKPIVVQPNSSSLSELFTLLSNGGPALEGLFEHGRSKGRAVAEDLL